MTPMPTDHIHRRSTADPAGHASVVVRVDRRSWHVYLDTQLVTEHADKQAAVEHGRAIARQHEPSRLTVYDTRGHIETQHTYHATTAQRS